MSCNLRIFIREKDKEADEDKDFILFRLSTSYARELDRVVNFQFDKITVLDDKKMEKITNYYKDYIREKKEKIKALRSENKQNYRLLPKVGSVEVFEHIKQDIADKKEYIEEIKEDLEYLVNVYNKWKDACRIIKRRKETSAVYYVFG